VTIFRSSSVHERALKVATAQRPKSGESMFEILSRYSGAGSHWRYGIRDHIRAGVGGQYHAPEARGLAFMCLLCPARVSVDCKISGRFLSNDREQCVAPKNRKTQNEMRLRHRTWVFVLRQMMNLSLGPNCDKISLVLSQKQTVLWWAFTRGESCDPCPCAIPNLPIFRLSDHAVEGKIRDYETHGNFGVSRPVNVKYSPRV